MWRWRARGLLAARPVFNLLEQTEMEVLVVNAGHMKQVPGRKTDIKDAEWIAELLQYGLLKGSSSPSRGSASFETCSATGGR